MKNVWSKILKIVKMFPLGSYGIFNILFMWFLMLIEPVYDATQMLPGLVLLLLLLSYPPRLVNDFANFLGMGWLVDFFNPPLLGICFFLFLLDLILLYLRHHLIPSIKTKNPKLLVPSLLNLKLNKKSTNNPNGVDES
jgi:hypothetical protein